MYSVKLFYSGKIGCIWAKVVLFGKWLYSDRVFFSAKSDLFGLSGCIRAKVVAFGQSVFFSGKNCCIPDKLL